MRLFDRELKFKIFFLSCLLLTLIIFIILLSKKNHEILAAKLEKAEETEKGFAVKTTKVKKSGSKKVIILNGETRPYQSVTI